MWVSCPQACIAPGISELNSSPVSSWSGRPSMSARRMMVGPGRAPSMTAVTELIALPTRGASPISLELGDDHCLRRGQDQPDLWPAVQASAHLDDLRHEAWASASRPGSASVFVVMAEVCAGGDRARRAPQATRRAAPRRPPLGPAALRPCGPAAGALRHARDAGESSHGAAPPHRLASDRRRSRATDSPLPGATWRPLAPADADAWSARSRRFGSRTAGRRSGRTTTCSAS